MSLLVTQLAAAARYKTSDPSTGTGNTSSEGDAEPSVAAQAYALIADPRARRPDQIAAQQPSSCGRLAAAGATFRGRRGVPSKPISRASALDTSELRDSHRSSTLWNRRGATRRTRTRRSSGPPRSGRAEMARPPSLGRRQLSTLLALVQEPGREPVEQDREGLRPSHGHRVGAVSLLRSSARPAAQAPGSPTDCGRPGAQRLQRASEAAPLYHGKHQPQAASIDRVRVCEEASNHLVLVGPSLCAQVGHDADGLR